MISLSLQQIIDYQYCSAYYVYKNIYKVKHDLTYRQQFASTLRKTIMSMFVDIRDGIKFTWDDVINRYSGFLNKEMPSVKKRQKYYLKGLVILRKEFDDVGQDIEVLDIAAHIKGEYRLKRVDDLVEVVYRDKKEGLTHVVHIAPEDSPIHFLRRYDPYLFGWIHGVCSKYIKEHFKWHHYKYKKRTWFRCLASNRRIPIKIYNPSNFAEATKIVTGIEKRVFFRRVGLGCRVCPYSKVCEVKDLANQKMNIAPHYAPHIQDRFS